MMYNFFKGTSIILGSIICAINNPSHQVHNPDYPSIWFAAVANIDTQLLETAKQSKDNPHKTGAFQYKDGCVGEPFQHKSRLVTFAVNTFGGLGYRIFTPIELAEYLYHRAKLSLAVNTELLQEGPEEYYPEEYWQEVQHYYLQELEHIKVVIPKLEKFIPKLKHAIDQWDQKHKKCFFKK